MDTNNLTQFMALMNANKNPQQMVMNMLEQRANQNPVYGNLAKLVKAGDTKGVEAIVRNIAKERGIDFDKEFNDFQKMFGKR